jgi:hypothetical protein
MVIPNGTTKPATIRNQKHGRARGVKTEKFEIRLYVNGRSKISRISKRQARNFIATARHLIKHLKKISP